MSARFTLPSRPLRRGGRTAAPAHLQPRARARQLDRRDEARRGIRHQPHAPARGAQGAGRRGPGDDEGAARRLRDRGVGHATWPTCTTCSRCWKAMPPAWWRRRRATPRSRTLQALHRELEARGEATATNFFAVNERFHMRLLEIAGNRWRDQMVADLRKVMKLNRHNSLLKSGPHRGIAGRAPRGDGRAGTARRRRRGQRMQQLRNGLEAAA